jgi:hypothetical protein
LKCLYRVVRIVADRDTRPNIAFSPHFRTFRTPEVTPANSAAGEIEMSPTCAVTSDVAQTLVSAAPRLRTPEVILAIWMRQGIELSHYSTKSKSD